MKSEIVLRHLHTLGRHFRSFYLPKNLELIWDDLISQPEEALINVIERLKRGPRYDRPTLETILSMTKAEAKQLQQRSFRRERETTPTGSEFLRLMRQFYDGEISRDEYEGRLRRL